MYSPQHPVLKHLDRCSFRSVRDQVSYLYKRKDDITFFVYSNIYGKTIFELNGSIHSPNLIYSLILS